MNSKSRRCFVVVTLSIGIALAFLLLTIGTSETRASAVEFASTPLRTYSPDRVLVKLRHDLSMSAQTGSSPGADVAAVDAVLYRYGALSAERVFPIAESPAIVPTSQDDALSAGEAGLGRIYRLDLSTDSDVMAVVAALSTDPAVEWAEPDYLAYPADTTPNDPLFPDQWGLQTIQAPAAWDVDTGNYTIAIAIVDSGIDFSHPDLSDKLWINPGEIPGNGLDDDNNGYVDDVNGWDFVNGDNDPSDDYGHGTQVAGIASADSNNGTGITGACWGCRIMPIKVMQVSGAANYSDIAAGVLYAAQKGSKVINISLGGYSDSATLRNAIGTAADTYGVVIVAGAGNDGVSTPFYPAAYADVIAVAGTTITDTKSAFSNYGTWVDISAPAVGITTTLMGGDYGAVDGTSFAAPFVSGVAGLLRSQHPDWSEAMMRAQIVYTADPIDVQNPGFEGMLGQGRLDAAAAVTESPRPLLAIASTIVNGDAHGRPTPGESASLGLKLTNEWLDAVDVTGTLSTSDSYITIGQGVTAFGDIVAGATEIGAPVYTFTVDGGAGYNHAILFTQTVVANSGACTATQIFTVTTRGPEESVAGTIVADTVWTSDKVYIVGGNVGVAPGVTLTIQAGTVVRFNGNYSLNVGGTLVADGGAAHSIRFLSNTGGNWNRIHFDDTSVDAVTGETGEYQSGNVLRHVEIEGAASGIACSGATPYLAYVTTDGGGLDCTLGLTSLWLADSNIYGNVSVSADLGFADTPGPGFNDIALDGYYAYVADASNSLRIIDVSDPAHPVEVSFYDTPGYAEGVGIAGGYAYLADYFNMLVIDVSDPVSPSLASTFPGSGDALLGADAVGDFAYLCQHFDGLRIVDVSDPYTPVLTGTYNSPGRAYDVSVVGNYAYVADSDAGLRVVDISTPTNPVETGFFVPPGSVQKLAIDGNIAYLAAGSSGGLRLVDISDPANPSELGWYDTPGTAQDVAVAGDYAYVADGGSGIRVVDISDVENPQEVGAYTQWSADTIATGNGYVYAGTGDGLRVYHQFGSKLAHILSTNVTGGNLSLPTISRVLSGTVSGDVTAGAGSIIQETTVRGEINIDGYGAVTSCDTGDTLSLESGIVSGNSVINGINLGSGSALSNTVTAGGIIVDEGLVQGNNIENASGWGIQSAGAITVTRNRVVGNISGIQVAGGLVQGNLIANNNGIGLEVSGGTILSNTLTGNGGNALVINSGTPTIQGNNLEGNHGAYDLANNTANPIIAAANWWGTTDGGIIGGRIYDFLDDFNLGEVTYTPVLTGPVQDAPAYVRVITLTPESPVGIETVAFDVLFSRPMDMGTNPAMVFHTIQKDTWRTYDTANSELAGNMVYAILVDAAGNKWFSTFGNGVSVLRADGTWQTYTNSNSGLADNRVFAIAVDLTGDKWFGTWGNGVSVLRTDESWQTYNNINSELEGTLIRAIAIDAVGSKWFGTWGDGVCVLRADGTWQTYNTSNSELVSNRIYAIAVDAADGKWFATDDGGVSTLRPDGTWQTYNTSNSGLASNQVYAVGVDSADGKWFGTNGGGVSMLHADGVWQTYNASNSGLVGNRVYAIAIDTTGVKWFGTFDNGASTLHPCRIWHAYNASNSELTNDVRVLVVDGVGSKWFGTEYNGVRVLQGGTQYVIADDPQWLAPNLYRASYDVTSLIPKGMYTITVDSALGPDGMAIARNSVYSFTVDYAGAIADTTPPLAPVVVADTCLSSTTSAAASWLATDPDTAITLYRYALGTSPGGIDVINWVDTVETSAVRTGLNLVQGQRYYFSVKARNEGGLWSEITSASFVAGVPCNKVYLPLVVREQ